MKIKYNIIISFLFFFIVKESFSQGFKNIRQKITYDRTIHQINTNRYSDATKYLTNSYVKNGTKDYTQYLQKAIDENKHILMPDFPVLITGLRLKSNTKIFFQEASKLILKPTDSEHYALLAIRGVENIDVYNATLEGDYDKHLGTKGEWGYGIDIRGSRNINIYSAFISNCWGDGICMTSNANQFTEGMNLFKTDKILIVNSIVDFNRRNGVTLTSGVSNITIDNILISNTFGTLPKAAIDIEPDHNRGKLDNIMIKNVLLFNNSAGINIYLNNYISSKEAKTAHINIQNVHIKNQISAFYIGGFAKRPSSLGISGEIKIKNVDIEDVNVPVNKGAKNFGVYPAINFSNIFVNKKRVLKSSPEFFKGIKAFENLTLDKKKIR